MTNWEMFRDTIERKSDENYSWYCVAHDLRYGDVYCKGMRCDVCINSSKKWLKKEYGEKSIIEQVPYDKYVALIEKGCEELRLNRSGLSRLLGKGKNYLNYEVSQMRFNATVAKEKYEMLEAKIKELKERRTWLR